MTDHPSWDDYPVPNNLPAPIINDPALPLVSIVTPSYNQGRFIGETIESVLGQDYPNLEYWVIDGGSTDETLDVLRQHEADARLHWVSEPDKGQSDAINKGLARCRGQIVGWLNSDDRHTAGAVRESVDYLQAHPGVDLVYGDHQEIDQAGRPLGRVLSEPFDFKRLVVEYLSLSQPTVLLRRDVISTVGLLRTDLHYIMDTDWYARMAAHGFTLAYCPGVRALFRRHETSKTTSLPLNFWVDKEQLLDAFFAIPGLPGECHAWKRAAYSHAAIYQAWEYAARGQRQEALHKAWEGIRLKPVQRRSLLALLIMLDATTGLRSHTWTARVWRQMARKAR